MIIGHEDVNRAAIQREQLSRDRTPRGQFASSEQSGCLEVASVPVRRNANPFRPAPD